VPVLPKWSGFEEYQGHAFHSVIYKTGREYVGQRVLVSGVGNSGAEIAADLAEQGASFVAISIRTPPPIVPRDLLGTPAQVFGILMSRLPPPLADRIGYTLARIAMGDLTRYGLRRPAWLPFTAKRIPIIDVGFIKEVKNGQVKVRPNIARFTRTGVVYEDGQEEAFDVVVAATGFTTGLDQLLEVTGVLDAKGFPRYPQGQPTGCSGLFFMGYVESHRGHLYEANLASRRLAKIVKKYLSSS
jgi:cation diffusion facilitator CzcD-associated flavoprotein CzcO